jgi:transcriptional regulator with XRE-family HTH domain
LPVSSAFVFEGLKMHLKARGMTYADVARGLRISEPTVKRIFASRNCDLKRLQALCEFVQVDLAELARGLPRQDRLIHRLRREQEEELMADPRLFLVAVCAIHQMRVEDISALYDIEGPECVALLLRLEKIGILELHENNRIRLRLARTFAWIPDGPIMRYAKSQTADFFNYSFSGAGQLMRMITVRISREAQEALVKRLEEVAREYNDQHSADARLPLEQRYQISVLLAARPWEPASFKALRRKKP